MRGLKAKIAIVTGSTSGIGAATARRLSEEGARVVVTGRNVERGTAVVSQITDAGGEAVWLPADLEVEDEVKGLIDRTVNHYSGLHVIVNNAAPTDLLFQGIGHDSIIDANYGGTPPRRSTQS